MDPENLWCLVDGNVTIANVDGKLSVKVNALNSYDMPVKLYYNAEKDAVENVNVDNTKTVKRLINGQLFIQRGEKTFNAHGAQVK